jgi:hypothetical protein
VSVGYKRKADLKQGRFSEEQIGTILKEAEVGTKVAELCRQRRHLGCDVLQLTQQVQRPGGIGAEAAASTRRRELAAQSDCRRPQALDIGALKDLGKNGYKPTVKRQMVADMRALSRT